jgi:hypothetical protein
MYKFIQIYKEFVIFYYTIFRIFILKDKKSKEKQIITKILL